MTQGQSDLIEVAAERRMEKGEAVAIWDGQREKFGRQKWTWLPKSQVEDNGDGTFTMPEWLAKDRGLI